MISFNRETLVVIDDCDGKTDRTNYFDLLQCPKKDFKKMGVGVWSRGNQFYAITLFYG